MAQTIDEFFNRRQLMDTYETFTESFEDIKADPERFARLQARTTELQGMFTKGFHKDNPTPERLSALGYNPDFKGLSYATHVGVDAFEGGVLSPDNASFGYRPDMPKNLTLGKYASPNAEMVDRSGLVDKKPGELIYKNLSAEERKLLAGAGGGNVAGLNEQRFEKYKMAFDSDLKQQYVLDDFLEEYKKTGVWPGEVGEERLDKLTELSKNHGYELDFRKGNIGSINNAQSHLIGKDTNFDRYVGPEKIEGIIERHRSDLIKRREILAQGKTWDGQFMSAYDATEKMATGYGRGETAGAHLFPFIRDVTGQAGLTVSDEVGLVGQHKPIATLTYPQMETGDASRPYALDPDLQREIRSIEDAWKEEQIQKFRDSGGEDKFLERAKRLEPMEGSGLPKNLGEKMTGNITESVPLTPPKALRESMAKADQTVAARVANRQVPQTVEEGVEVAVRRSGATRGLLEASTEASSHVASGTGGSRMLRTAGAALSILRKRF
jgi:hypothetical protein